MLQEIQVPPPTKKIKTTKNKSSVFDPPLEIEQLRSSVEPHGHTSSAGRDGMLIFARVK